MTNERFETLLVDLLSQTQHVLGVKAREYVREGNRLHNFDVGAQLAGKTREEVLDGFRLKHIISISDMRQDIKEGNLPTEALVREKFGDAINYYILEYMSVMDRLDQKNPIKGELVEEEYTGEAIRDQSHLEPEWKNPEILKYPATFEEVVSAVEEITEQNKEKLELNNKEVPHEE